MSKIQRTSIRKAKAIYKKHWLHMGLLVKRCKVVRYDWGIMFEPIKFRKIK
jgi:hypothetical protein